MHAGRTRLSQHTKFSGGRLRYLAHTVRLHRLGRPVSCWLIVGMVWAATAASVSAASVVHLEIIQEAGGAIDGPQRWIEQLRKLPISSVQVRGSRPGDRPQIQQRGSTEQPTFHVTAVLTSRNELQLPGAKFRLGDVQGLSRWLENLGPAGQAEEPAEAFGLSPQQLVKLRRDLASPLRNSSIHQTTRAVITELQQATVLPIAIDPGAREAFSRAPDVLDEFQGLAVGTVLAAVLRSAGLGFVPERNQGDSIRLTIVAADRLDDVWPVGWPSRQNTRQTIPKLFEFLPVEIVATPLSQALEAIKPRLGAPLLIDRNGLAARQIDLDAVKVRYPAGRTFYKKLLDRLLFQARLEAVVLVDDGDRPFLWIQPIRRSPRGALSPASRLSVWQSG